MRGLSGDENLPRGYLVNGFYGGRGVGGPRDASVIERIEVLTGPNAALFGRGEPGGSVNLVTKRPSFDTGGSLGVSVGRFDRCRGDVDWNLPRADRVSVRLVGSHEDAESLRDTLETRRYGGTPSVLVRVGERTTLT